MNQNLKQPKGQHQQNHQKFLGLQYNMHSNIKKCQNQNYVQNDQLFLNSLRNIAFIKNNIVEQLTYYITKPQITNQICDLLHTFAKLHKQATILNENTLEDHANIANKNLICKCGCKKIKGKKISLLSEDKYLQGLGPGPIVLLVFIKWIIFLLLIFVVVYCLFAVITNIMGNIVDKSICQDDYYCIFKLISSDQNKTNYNFNSTVQKWLGVVFCIIWVFSMRIILYFGQKRAQDFDQKFNTSSDFAIKIQNLPAGQYQEIQLKSYIEGILNQALQKEQQRDLNYKKKGIKSIQIVYDMSKCREVIDQIFQKCDKLYSMLNENENKQKIIINQHQIEQYIRQKEQIIRQYHFLQDFRKKFLNESSFRRNISTTCCLVQFHQAFSKNIILKYYGKDKVLLSEQIINRLKSFFSQQNIGLFYKGNIITIERAPEPSDMIWTNCQVKYSIFRIMIIYGVTFLIILVSFGLISLLKYIQSSESKQLKEPFTNLIFNYLMSVVLGIVNKLLWITLYYLLEIQYNHTITQKIISLMDKALFANSINIIVLPIISFYILNKRLYGIGGLTGYIFQYHISLATISIITKLLQPRQIIKEIALSIPFIRNKIIRYLCSSVLTIDLQKGVPAINRFYQKPKFDISDSYVTILSAIFHASFFIQLQPAIGMIVLVMVTLYYGITKYKLLRSSKLPQMIDFMVFKNGVERANYLPIFYGVGSLIMSYLANQLQDTKQYNFVQFCICLGIGAIGLINPNNCLTNIIRWIFNQVKVEPKRLERQKKMESYYSGNNCLTLLGLEDVFGGGFGYSSSSQLKRFCQSFNSSIDEDHECSNVTFVSKIYQFRGCRALKLKPIILNLQKKAEINADMPNYE